MNFLSKYWPTILSLATAATGLFSTQIQGAIAHHPTLIAVGAAILGIVSHLWPSPVTAQSASTSAK